MKGSSSDRIRRFRHEFARGVPERLARLSACWTEAKRQRVSALSVFHREVHSLAGASGAFGYRRLHERARELETLVRAMASTSTISSAMEEEIARRLTQIQSSFEHDQADLNR